MPIKGWLLPWLGLRAGQGDCEVCSAERHYLGEGELLSPWPDTQSGRCSSSWIYSHSLRAGESS